MTQPGTSESQNSPESENNAEPQNSALPQNTAEWPAAAEGGALPQKPKKSKKAKVLSILIIVVLACAFAGFRIWMKINSGERAIQKSVEMTLDENKLPVQVDQVTKWTALKADGKTIIFTYEITDDVAETFNADAANAETMEEGLDQQTCRDSSLKKQFSNGATVRYDYFTEGGEKVFTHQVKSGDC
ncbi:MAG: hypothetical protein ACTH9H_08750 [Galactobacter sp.]